MDRLTRTGQDFENEFCSGCDCVYYGEPNGCNHPDGNCGSYTYFTLVADRLAEYEDAGLTPEQIADLQAENAELKAKLDKAVEDMRGYCKACVNLPKSLDFEEITKPICCECNMIVRQNWQWRGLEDAE